MAWTKAKTAIVVSVAALLVTSTATTLTIQHRHRSVASGKMEMRIFKVDTRIFLDNLREAMNPAPSASATNIAAIAADFFASKGITFQPPKSIVSFNAKPDLLYVRATPPELDAVERIVQQLNTAPTQVHMKAHFIQVPESNVDAILKAGTTINSADKNIIEIVTADKAASLIRRIRGGDELTLAIPEVVTIAGRQTQMRTGPTQMGTPNPTVDLVPTVLADGYTVRMKAIVSTPDILTAQVNIWDGQTLVLAPINSDDGKTRLFVFVTTTIIDPAGNRVHTENKLPFNPSTIPPQD